MLSTIEQRDSDVHLCYFNIHGRVTPDFPTVLHKSPTKQHMPVPSSRSILHLHLPVQTRDG